MTYEGYIEVHLTLTIRTDNLEILDLDARRTSIELFLRKRFFFFTIMFPDIRTALNDRL